jgi:hypothetical protein
MAIAAIIIIDTVFFIFFSLFNSYLNCLLFVIAFGFWLLALGSWLFAFSSWLLAFS